MQDDLRIWNARELGHQECCRAHDGGHDLAARRSRGLDAACERRLETFPPHHRYRDHTGGDDVGHRTSRYGAHQSTRDDGDLGTAAGASASNGPGEIDEELRDAEPLQKRAKDDEQKNVLDHHLQGWAQYAVEREILLCQDTFQAEGGRAQQARQRRAVEQWIEQEHDAEHWQGEARRTPCRLEDQNDGDTGDDKVGRIHRAGATEHVLEVDGDIQRDSEPECRQNEIDADTEHRSGALAPAEEQEGIDQREAEEHGAHNGVIEFECHHRVDAKREDGDGHHGADPIDDRRQPAG